MDPSHAPLPNPHLAISPIHRYGVLTVMALVATVPVAALVEGRTIAAGTAATLKQVGATHIPKHPV